MTDYIERETAKEAVVKAIGKGHSPFNAIVMLPAADVVPVRRGKWIEDRTFGPICSVCSHTAAAAYDEEPWPTPYCPFCGANMREES